MVRAVPTLGTRIAIPDAAGRAGTARSREPNRR